MKPDNNKRGMKVVFSSTDVRYRTTTKTEKGQRTKPGAKKGTKVLEKGPVTARSSPRPGIKDASWSRDQDTGAKVVILAVSEQQDRQPGGVGSLPAAARSSTTNPMQGQIQGVKYGEREGAEKESVG